MMKSDEERPAKPLTRSCPRERTCPARARANRFRRRSPPCRPRTPSRASRRISVAAIDSSSAFRAAASAATSSCLRASSSLSSFSRPDSPRPSPAAAPRARAGGPHRRRLLLHAGDDRARLLARRLLDRLLLLRARLLGGAQLLLQLRLDLEHLRERGSGEGVRRWVSGRRCSWGHLGAWWKSCGRRGGQLDLSPGQSWSSKADLLLELRLHLHPLLHDRVALLLHDLRRLLASIPVPARRDLPRAAPRCSSPRGPPISSPFSSSMWRKARQARTASFKSSISCVLVQAALVFVERRKTRGSRRRRRTPSAPSPRSASAARSRPAACDLLDLLLDHRAHLLLLLVHRVRARVHRHREARLAEAEARRPLLHLRSTAAAERACDVQQALAGQPLLQHHRQLRLAERDVLRPLGEDIGWDERELGRGCLDPLLHVGAGSARCSSPPTPRGRRGCASRGAASRPATCRISSACGRGSEFMFVGAVAGDRLAPSLYRACASSGLAADVLHSVAASAPPAGSVRFFINWGFRFPKRSCARRSVGGGAGRGGGTISAIGRRAAVRGRAWTRAGRRRPRPSACRDASMEISQVVIRVISSSGRRRRGRRRGGGRAGGRAGRR